MYAVSFLEPDKLELYWIVLTYILVFILRSELACVQNYYENNKCFYVLYILGDVLLCVPR